MEANNAAAKREAPTAEKSSEVGNAAAMREALVWMKERMNAAIYDGSFDCNEALDKIDAALAAPARNGDRFASAWDVLKIWDKGLDTASDMVALIEWFLAPAEQEGAGK